AAVVVTALVALAHPFYYYPDVDTHARSLAEARADPGLPVEPGDYHRPAAGVPPLFRVACLGLAGGAPPRRGVGGEVRGHRRAGADGAPRPRARPLPGLRRAHRAP